MKLIFKRHKHEWQSGICRGKGGISSLIVGRVAPFLKALGVFSIRNLIKCLRIERKPNLTQHGNRVNHKTE